MAGLLALRLVAGLGGGRDPVQRHYTELPYPPYTRQHQLAEINSQG